MITVTVNKKDRQFAADTTVSALLAELDINPGATAVAINDTVVPKTEYSSRKLYNGDKVIIIKAFYGG